MGRRSTGWGTALRPLLVLLLAWVAAAADYDYLASFAATTAIAKDGYLAGGFWGKSMALGPLIVNSTSLPSRPSFDWSYSNNDVLTTYVNSPQSYYGYPKERGEANIFVSRVDDHGTPIWAVTFTGSGSVDMKDMAVDAKQNAFVLVRLYVYCGAGGF
jgi:hypothetical protein